MRKDSSQQLTDEENVETHRSSTPVPFAAWHHFKTTARLVWCISALQGC